jgi:hypothetical protein
MRVVWRRGGGRGHDDGDDADAVTFEVLSIARGSGWLGRLVFPFNRGMQVGGVGLWRYERSFACMYVYRYMCIHMLFCFLGLIDETCLSICFFSKNDSRISSRSSCAACGGLWPRRKGRKTGGGGGCEYVHKR